MVLLEDKRIIDKTKLDFGKINFQPFLAAENPQLPNPPDEVINCSGAHMDLTQIGSSPPPLIAELKIYLLSRNLGNPGKFKFYRDFILVENLDFGMQEKLVFSD